MFLKHEGDIVTAILDIIQDEGLTTESFEER